ncbi:MAG: type VI secretion system tip protein TssI/VgrG [Polyangiales bacterium]
MSTRSDDPLSPGGLPAAGSAFGSTTEFIVSRPTREPAPDAAFTFGARSLQGADVRLVGADIRESLGELYEAVVELCTRDAAVDYGALLGGRAVVEVERGPRKRRLCGVVRRVERIDSWAGLRRARVVMAPAMWALSQRLDSRIYQHLDALEIVKAVFDEAGLDAPALETRRERPKREYCVQYRETDLAFVLRLLEEEGVALYFRHDGDAETPVLTDGPTYALCPTIDRRAVPFSPPQSEQAPVEVVQRLDEARELRATSYMGRDHDFTRPLASLDLTRSHPRGDPGPRPRYEYPARFTLGPYDEGSRTYGPHDGGHLAELRDGEERAAEATALGAGNVTGFMPGRFFQLVGHEHPDLDRKYLLTRVEHYLRAPEELLAEGQSGPRASGEDRYRNAFGCVPADVPFVPPRRTPRPMVLAAQTAVVTSDGDEDVHVDAHGRIKVQFRWDRKGRHDARSSCWVRVEQNWAGAGWGFMFIPRLGMEVVVTFLEGDPDRPVVTGCLYNGVNRPPYELPEKRTVSTIKSNSTPGGHGFNELRFDDLADHEEVFLHAQRDLNEIVNHDHSLTVWNDQRIYIKGHQYVTVEGQGETPKGMPGPGHGVKVTGQYNIDASGDVSITSGSKIVLKVGGSSITITDASIDIKTGGSVKVDGADLWLNGSASALMAAPDLTLSGSTRAVLVGGEVVVAGDTLGLSGEASANLSSSGTTDVSGTPVQLNGPGLFAGRVTEQALVTITTGAALVLVGGAAFPYSVSMDGDTMLVGPNIKIKASEGTYKDFQARVLRDLGIMSQTPHGKQRLENIQKNPGGHKLTIQEYTAADAAQLDSDGYPFGKDNSFAFPVGGDPNAQGPASDGSYVAGKGADSEIHYNPDIKLGPKGQPEPADAVLYHEMGHADHNMNGVNRGAERMPAYTDREDWQNIEGGVNEPGGTQVPTSPKYSSPTENEYLGDRNYPYRRTDHADGYAPR